MFVQITTPKKPLEAEKLFRACWRKGEEITPKICMDVLRSTNYATCIKRMLECVERLDAARQAEFKEVVLSVFTNRGQPEEVREIAERLAIAGGYDDELKNTAKQFVEGADYICSSADTVKATPVTKEFLTQADLENVAQKIFLSLKVQVDSKATLPECLDFLHCDEVELCFCNLRGVKELKFKEGSFVNFSHAQNLPENLDVSMCSKVIFDACHLAGVKNLKFGEGATVNFGFASLPDGLDVSQCDKVCIINRAVPKNTDVSNCSEVCFNKCNLEKLTEIKFKKGAKADLSLSFNFPEDLDVSQCAEVNFNGCDLGVLKHLKFREGATVNLVAAKNLPEDTDLSLVAELDAGGCDFSNIQNLRFKENSVVDLHSPYTKLPKCLDVSRCQKVRLDESDLSTVEVLTFKSREQMVQSHAKLPENWPGKLVIVEEEVITKPKEDENENGISTLWKRFKRFGR